MGKHYGGRKQELWENTRPGCKPMRGRLEIFVVALARGLWVNLVESTVSGIITDHHYWQEG